MMNYMSHSPYVIALVGNNTLKRNRVSNLWEKVINHIHEALPEHRTTIVSIQGNSYQESIEKLFALRDELDAVIAVGGDGTLNLVVNAATHMDLPVGIIPLGSGNDFARSMQIPINHLQKSVYGVMRALVENSTIPITLGHITFGEELCAESKASDAVESNVPTLNGRERYYAGMLSCGIDAVISSQVNHLQFVSGTMAYFAATAKAVLSMKPYDYHVKYVDEQGEEHEKDMSTDLLTIANSRIIGGGIVVSPYSLPTDDYLEMIWLTRKPTWSDRAKAMRHAYDGQLLDSTLFGVERVKSVEITQNLAGNIIPTLTADGDDMGQAPVKVVPSAKKMSLLMPQSAIDNYLSKVNAQTSRELMIRDGRCL